MKDFIETLQGLLPWAAGLPPAPKIALTLIIVAAAALLLMLLWMPPPKEPKSDESEPPAEHNRPATAELRIADLVVLRPLSLNPVLDIKLLNVGQTTVFLTRVSVNVLERAPYPGVVPPSGTYDLLIASDRNELKVAHEIPSNGTDRLIITLGAAPHNLACGFLLQVQLIYNGDQSTLSEPFRVSFVNEP